MATVAWSTLEVAARGKGITFKVKVTPRARKEGISGVSEGALVVKVNAPALEERANTAVIALLSKVLQMRPNAFSFHLGERSRNKVIFLDAVTPAEFLERLRAQVTL